MDKNNALITLAELGRFWKVEFEELSPGEKVFRAIWDLESDVNNGGFDQYYFNSSGDTAFAVVAALQEIGAHIAAKIVSNANAAFPEESPPMDRNDRQDQLEQIGPKNKDLWGSLSEEFISYPDDLTELLFEYVRREAPEIEGASDVWT